MKRLTDLTLALIGIVLFSPIMLLLVVVIRVRLGSPVFFKQRRPGLKGTPFDLVKFRTMTSATDQAGRLLPDAIRLTRLGNFLRSTSLDELPGLFNVVRGQLSLVGPRPLLMKYLPLYSKEQARRHDVKPGLTGWAQIKGRNAIDWPDKFALDIWYVDNQSFWLDIRILLATVRKVIVREGISAQGEATMPEFTGNASSSEDGRTP